MDQAPGWIAAFAAAAVLVGCGGGTSEDRAVKDAAPGAAAHPRGKGRKPPRKDAPVEGAARPTYDPATLLPLAVGNTWTYRWRSPAVRGTEEVETDEPIYYGIQHFEHGGKSMFALGYHRKARAHEETYTVVRRDADHYFFTVAATPEVPPGQLRDGRYEHSRENCWTLWDKRRGGSGGWGVTESIKRQWTYPSRQYLLKAGPAKPGELPIDNRNVLMEPGRKLVWTGKDRRVTKMIEYRWAAVVRVPAGEFKDCFELVHTCPRSKEEIEKPAKADDDAKKDAGRLPTWALFETHTFWAPRVGMVRECQKLSDGRVAYELELVKHTLAGKDGAR